MNLHTYMTQRCRGSLGRAANQKRISNLLFIHIPINMKACLTPWCAGSLSPAGSSSREDCVCIDGYSGNAGEACSACLAGTYCKRGLIYRCKQNSISPRTSADATDCICLEGHVGNDGERCFACPMGTYKDVNGSAPGLGLRVSGLGSRFE
jgi:hypothetical protein